MRAPFLAAIAAPLAIFGSSIALNAQTPDMPTTAPGTMNASRVASGTYAVESTHALVGWKVNHFGFSDYFGQFGNVTGSLTLDRARPANSRVDVTIPVNSLATVNEELTHHLLSGDFFDAANQPTARFVSRSVRVRGMRATIVGDLTLKGVTKPVTLDARFIGAGTNPFSNKETVGFNATTTIKRSDFNMGMAVPLVTDNVELTITVPFEK